MNTVAENQNNQDDLDLCREAVTGSAEARAQINTIADPIIRFQTDKFCKRFCAENRYHYRCTLQSPWDRAGADASLCEWGNGSYAWMLFDLCSDKRLGNYQGRDGARLYDYFFTIANSLPFYERWKNWRFERRIHVPQYIIELDPNAKQVFLSLRSGDNIAMLAQRLTLGEDQIRVLVTQVVNALAQRNKLYYLNPEKTVSMHPDDDEQDNHDIQIASFDPDPAQRQEHRLLHQAWQKLSAVEQFVLEAMVIDNMDAADVLAALKKLDIAISDKIPAQNTDRQQLYYFKRKTLAKLAQLHQGADG